MLPSLQPRGGGGDPRARTHDPWVAIGAPRWISRLAASAGGVGAGVGLGPGCEEQVAAGLVRRDFPCGGPLSQQVIHMLADPLFYWLARPAVLCDLAHFTNLVVHLSIIALTAGLLAATSAGLLAAPPPASDGRRRQVAQSAAWGAAGAPGSAAATAGAAACARAAAVAAAWGLLATYWAVREPLILFGAPYKCGVLQIAGALMWRQLRQRAAAYCGPAGAATCPSLRPQPDWWRLTVAARMTDVMRAAPLAMAALAVAAAHCHAVRPRMLTAMALTSAASCTLFALTLPALVDTPAGLPAAAGASGGGGGAARLAALRSMLLPTLMIGREAAAATLGDGRRSVLYRSAVQHSTVTMYAKLTVVASHMRAGGGGSGVGGGSSDRDIPRGSPVGGDGGGVEAEEAEAAGEAEERSLARSLHAAVSAAAAELGMQELASPPPPPPPPPPPLAPDMLAAAAPAGLSDPSGTGELPAARVRIDPEVWGSGASSGASSPVGGGGAEAAAAPLLVGLHLMGLRSLEGNGERGGGGGGGNNATGAAAVEHDAFGGGGATAAAAAAAGSPPTATWLGSVPLLLAPPGPAAELQALWDRMVAEVQRGQRRQRQPRGEQLDGEGGGAAGFGGGTGAAVAVGGGAGDGPRAEASITATASTAAAPTAPIVTADDNNGDGGDGAGGAGEGYSEAAAEAFRHHMAPLIQDLVVAAAAGDGRGARGPPLPSAPAPTLQPSPTRAEQGGAAATAASAAVSVSASAPSAVGSRLPTPSAPSPGTSPASLAPLRPPTPPELVSQLLGFLRVQGMGQTHRWVESWRRAEGGGGDGGGGTGTVVGVGGGGGGARDRASPLRQVVGGGPPSSRLALTPLPPLPPAVEALAAEGASGALAEPPQARAKADIGGDHTVRGSAVAALLAALPGGGAAVEAAAAAPPCPASQPQPGLFRRAAAAAGDLCGRLAAPLAAAWWGFPDPDREAAFCAWQAARAAARAAAGGAVVAAFASLGMVALLATKMRLERYGVRQPLLKALAGMLWLSSPLAGQLMRLAAWRLATWRLGSQADRQRRPRRQQQPGREGAGREVGAAGAGPSRRKAAPPLTGSGGDAAAAAAVASYDAAVLSRHDTLAAASTGLIASLLGFLTYTCSRPSLDVRQDEPGFVFGILMGRAVLPPLLTQLRMPTQLLVSLGMAAVDAVHAHVLWGGGAVASAVLAAGAAAAAVVNVAVSAVLDARQRRVFLSEAAAAGAGSEGRWKAGSGTTGLGKGEGKAGCEGSGTPMGWV
ncbi:hypothetical protein GPECTOR_236g554 [Gonium pectorale]|uniref:Uncharacterized protein n=1 Tax=Gonium pectorale TaxID=33097 RepID=A0A150FY51_GONPE|nr:hypothetical protein GPECTOR_236g554 [Gonium pectorale]|eukprot:KXZ41950.1 hypothetical protein GPECTOR_236g554 [Gonium pectorale]